MTHSLPKGKEDHQLDRDNFEEWAMLCKVAFELDVELNDTVHRYRYTNAFYDHDLKLSTCGLEAFGAAKPYPDMSKSWANRFETIPTKSLCDDCY